MKRIKNLLIVDDDTVSSYLISSTLEDMAVADRIATVYNGKQALDFLDQNCFKEQATTEEFCPAFILLDINMPIMDGFEFLEELQHKYADWFDKITICILSSSSANKDKLKAQKYPIAGFLTKPLNEESLMPLIEKI